MKYLALITGCLLLTGCATGYQAHTWSGGYKDKEKTDGGIFLGGITSIDHPWLKAEIQCK